MTKQRSRYDELHDYYYELLSTKSGTRYERLAAIVFKCLEQSDTVIHDLKLLGDSGVPHQIDVIIERNGQKRRIVVECKDFDISGDKVGLGIVRDFYGAIADFKPDESYVVTCNGFTSEAERYARSMRIGLVVLRKFRESDWAGRVRQINLHMTMVISSQPTIEIEFQQDDAWQKIDADLQAIGRNLNYCSPEQPVFFNTPKGRFQANTFIQQNMNYSASTPPGLIEHDIDISDITFEVSNFGSVELKRLHISFEVLHIEETIQINGERIAKLLLQGIGLDDKVIWDDDLRQFKIDNSTGEVL